MPVGAGVLALAHLLAPGNRKVYQLASILFTVVMIVALLLSFLVTKRARQPGPAKSRWSS